MCQGPDALRQRKQVSEAITSFDDKPLFDKEKEPIYLPDPAPFSVSQVRACIPEHCFVRSALTSSLYIVSNLVIVGLMWLVADKFVGVDGLPQWVHLVFWPAWWFLQGAFMTGVWVLGHECGHQAQFNSRLANDTVGLVLHTALLVPFHSWKHSHSLHHGNCCSMERDEVFLPFTRSQLKQDGFTRFMLGWAPLRLFYITVFFLLLGWPLHLFVHATGSFHNKKGWVNHFNPYCDLFTPKLRSGVIVSDLALGGFCYFLYTCVQSWGLDYMIKMYFVPYVITNCWLVTITHLQHTDTYVPHYRGREWNWLRGALATVDRDFGWFLNTAMHHIQDTHVAHHLFHTMPHYHAQEATKALRKFLGPYHLVDNTPPLTAVWRSWRDCRFVEDEGGVLFYKQKLSQESS